MNRRFELPRQFVAALALLVSGCHIAGAKMHNLDELHWTDGRHKRSGQVWSDYEYAIRVGVRGLLAGFGKTSSDGDPEKIDDPLEECVENLNELAGFSDDDPWIAARQVEYCARIAVDDPWQLSREIAVRALGRHGERLAMRAHPWKKPEGEAAGVELVRDALRRLIQASGPVLRKAASEDEVREFAAACESVRALVLDREGALRLLKSVSILERVRSETDPALAPLRELGLHLQRTCLSLALDAALTDEAPEGHSGSDPGWRTGLVQGAAVETCARVWGAPALGRMMLRFSPRDPEPERLLGFLRAVRDHGLPPAPVELNEEERARAPDVWLESIYLIASEYPDGRVRLAAMAALGKISGREPHSIREEDWQAWWLARQAATAGSAAQ